MSGSRSGCAAIIQQETPMALYHHCAAHRLNIAVLSACKIMFLQKHRIVYQENGTLKKNSARQQNR